MSEKIDTIEDSIADSGAIISRVSAKLSQRIRAKGYAFTKRSFDIFTGTIGAIATLPLLATVKAIYLINGDTAPIIYKQKRIGKGGEEFEIRKIRSMIPDADEVLKQLLKNPQIRKEWNEYQKLENDPRITKIGGFLRKTSLDEFPQFFNILDGSMSLVGPRPLIKGELDEHHGNHEVYESVKPGLTGWWGANGRSDVNYNERLQQEYFYIENRSIKMDLLCIAKTAKGVLAKDGAK